jgi:type II secretion system protein N
MQFLKNRFLWALYIICAALFFFYYLFPSDAVKEYLAGQIRQRDPNLTVKIGRVSPAFPPGLKLYDVSVSHLGQTLGTVKNLIISPDILSLFLATTHLSFQGKGYGGVLKGRVDVIKTSAKRAITIDADLAGIQVNQLEALSAITTHKISGMLDGKLAFKAESSDQALTGDLTLTDGQIEFSPPILNQDVVTFDTIDTELVFDGRSLNINRCELAGKQLDADVSGSIHFSGRSAGQILNLSGTLRPQEILLAKLGKNVPQLLANANLQNQGIPFKITGPVGSPRYSFY